MKRGYWIALLLPILLMIGCGAPKKELREIEKKLEDRQFDAASKQVEEIKEKTYSHKNRVLFYLDAGMVHHYDRNWDKSNERLEEAERAIEDLFTESVTRAAASYILNDNVKEYDGEDYEDIYLNVFKSLNYLGKKEFDGAFVEIRRINNKLNLLEDKYKKLADEYNKSKDSKAKVEVGHNQFHNSALGRWLSMLIYRAEGDIDNARIDLNAIDDAWKNQRHIYNFSKPKFDHYLDITDKARIDIIGFIGKSPEKKAHTLYIHTENNLIVFATTAEDEDGRETMTNLAPIQWPGIEQGLHFKFELPFFEPRGTIVRSVRVFIDDKQAGQLELLEDMEKVAIETYAVKKPLILMKTLTRTIVKGLIAHEGKKQMDKEIDNPLLAFGARLATDIAVDATEQADLRLSHFFPAKVMVNEFEVEPGEHHVVLEYRGAGGNLLYTHDMGTKNFEKGQLNLLESYYLK